MNPVTDTNTTVELEIDAVAHGGDGVGRVSGMVCFVEGALPGDKVRAQVYRRGPRAIWANTLEVVEPSPSRIPCPERSERPCVAACSWRFFAYPDQAAWKQRIVADSLKRIGGITAEIAWIEEPALRFGYRTRAVFHGDGEALGYYAPRTHTIVPIDDCPLNHERMNGALQALQTLEIQGDVHLTVNPEGEEILLWMRDVPPEVRERFPLWNGPGDADRHAFLFDGVPVVNGAFSQSSLLLNRMLRAHVSDCLGETESLLDLYCGNGNLSLPRAENCKVLGIDHAGPVVDAAARIASDAYVCGDERLMARHLAGGDWDVVLLDPPRTGAKALAGSLARAKARRIVYVSCDPATLARDLGIIIKGGWTLVRVTALDMFPCTPHVETVCVLERKAP